MDAAAMAKALGRRGGRARARRLPAAEKARIASLGGHARQRSLKAARRIDENFRYAVAADALRGKRHPIARLHACEGPLPGIYRDTR